MIRYVGKTIRPKERFRSHLLCKGKTHRSCWIKSLVLQGISPKFEIIETITSPKPGEWEQSEKFWIHSFKLMGYNLTNGTEGGDGLSNPTKEIREKIGSALRGRKHTPEQNAGHSAILRGRRHTPEHILKCKIARTGLKRSEAFKEHMRKVSKGRPKSEEHKLKLSEAITKLQSDPEYRRLMSERMKVRWKNGAMGGEVHRLRLSIAAKRDWAKRKSIKNL